MRAPRAIGRWGRSRVERWVVGMGCDEGGGGVGQQGDV